MRVWDLPKIMTIIVAGKKKVSQMLRFSVNKGRWPGYHQAMASRWIVSSKML